MSEIDNFSIQLYEQAKRFLEKAKMEASDEGKNAYLHAALLIGVSALEAHVNAIADELLSTWEDLDVLERSILSERDFVFESGSFRIVDKLKMYRLIDRVEFIFHRFSPKEPLDKSEIWWSQLAEALKIRNELVHPKGRVEINDSTVTRALQGILEALNAIYKALFNAPYPAYGRRLDSKLVF